VGQAVTDNDGYYNFSGLPPGRYSVSIQYEECPYFIPSSSPLESLSPSFSPSSNPSEGPSLNPIENVSGQPSGNPSETPSMYPSRHPSLAPSFSTFPTPQPTESPSLSQTIRKRVPNPCVDTDEPLIGVVVLLLNYRGALVGQAVTDNDGYYNFSGLPPGRYSVSVQFEECSSFIPSNSPLESLSPSLSPSSNPSERPSLNPSENLSGQPSGNPSETSSMYPSRHPSLAPSFSSKVPSKDRRHLSKTDYEFQLFLTNNHAFKFYKNGEVCDVKLSISSEDELSTGSSVHFDTLDECCANMFWFDMDGCSTRSPVAFQFEFCVDISGFDEYSDCPMNEIQSVEREMQKGLGQNSTLALVQFGSTILRKVGDEIQCIGPTDRRNLTTNKLRGRVALQDDKLTICGVVATKETSCSNETCLRDTYDKVIGPFESHVYSRAFSTSLHSSAGDGLQMAKVVASSLTTRKLVFPSTVPTEDKSAAANEHFANNKDTPRFYPTYIFGTLCHSKTLFDSWEQSYTSLKDCCESHFSWDLAACCSSLNMGGC
jgi:hypothetical protein